MSSKSTTKPAQEPVRKLRFFVPGFGSVEAVTPAEAATLAAEKTKVTKKAEEGDGNR